MRQRQRDYGRCHSPAVSGAFHPGCGQPAQGRAVRSGSGGGPLVAVRVSADMTPRSGSSGTASGADTDDASGPALSATERKLRQLGLSRPEDFVVHLPLRYEDETRVVPISSLAAGQTAQIEGHIVHSEVLFRPRRQLHAVIADDTDSLNLRWINFYPRDRKSTRLNSSH